MSEDGLRPPSDPAGAAAAAARFAAAVADEVDVAYAVVDSPLGELVGAATPEGLVALRYADHDGGVDAVLERLAERLSPRILNAPPRLDDLRRELDEYFGGHRRRFDVAIDWALVSDFGRRILAATADVPFGQTATYRDVATGAGNPLAARAAGRALGANPIPIVIPCHRIIGTNGTLTGYTGGIERKVALLQIEGIAA